MNVAALLTTDTPNSNPLAALRQLHPYPTRNASASFHSPVATAQTDGQEMVDERHAQFISPGQPSLDGPPPKLMVFEALIPDDPTTVHRLPLRVHIQHGDSPEQIISTIIKFWGLYEYGITLEDRDGITMIARYENFSPDEVIYVRAHRRPENTNGARRSTPRSHSPRKPHLDEQYPILPRPNFPRSDTRSPARLSRTRHITLDDGHGERDVSNGMSDSDAGSVSVTSSRRAKNDHLASADISLENIVEGGRRNQAKFESSQLPLFAPPQQRLAASMSSISPQRGFTQSLGQIPTPLLKPYNRDYPQALLSPQSYGQADYSSIMGSANPDSAVAEIVNDSDQFGGKNLRTRNQPSRTDKTFHGYYSNGLLPTPDPTIGSVVSDEDVALQLMRLGDPARFPKTRTSTSTVDDTLSGKADAASSGPSTEEDEIDRRVDRLPIGQIENRRQSADDSVISRKRLKTTNASIKQYHSEESSDEENDYSKENLAIVGAKAHYTSDHLPRHKGAKSMKPPARKTSSVKLASKAPNADVVPPSPYIHTQASRTASIGSTIKSEISEEDADLSTKPRCQRCRKSKKGCDRQRPCQRCKDAGIGVEGCISEDEGNGRKGRFGRHMGVSLKISSGEPLSPTAPTHPSMTGTAFHDDLMASENPKKRKR